MVGTPERYSSINGNRDLACYGRTRVGRLSRVATCHFGRRRLIHGNIPEFLKIIQRPVWDSRNSSAGEAVARPYVVAVGEVHTFAAFAHTRSGLQAPCGHETSQQLML